MKIPNIPKPIRNSLKHLALGITAATTFFGASPTANASVSYDFAGDTPTLEGWAQIWPATGTIWQKIPSGWGWVVDNGSLGVVDGENTAMARSPEFIPNGTDDLTYTIFGGISPEATPGTNPSGIPQAAFDSPTQGFMGVALRDATTNTYLIIKPHLNDFPPKGTPPLWDSVVITAAEITAANPDNHPCTLDLIDTWKGGSRWVILGSATLPGTIQASSGCDIFTYGADGVISGTDITLTMPYGTNLETLVPAYKISPFATSSGQSESFATTNPLNYTITAENGGTTKTYTVTVIVTPVSTACDILTYGPDGVISGTDITMTVPYGTNLATLTPSYTISQFATITGPTPDFSVANPADYTVTAQNGDTKTYHVTVNVTPANSGCDILTFGADGVISGTNISLAVPYGTNLATLAPTYTISPFATGVGPTPNFATANPATYTITSQSGETKDYHVTITEKPASVPPVTDGLIVCLAADMVNLADNAQVRIVGADTFVKQWNDVSGNAHHATQATAGDQPKYIASGLNGYPVLRFTQRSDDAGSKLTLGDLSESFPTAGAMFAVSTINSDGRYNLFDNSNNDSRWVANTWTECNPGVFRSGRTNFGTNLYASWPQTGSHVFTMESNSSLYRFVVDGSQIGSTGGSYHKGSGQNWTIGDRPTGGQQLNGDIPEILLYNRVLTTDEANLVGAYLAQKYNLATTYPAMPAPSVPTGLVAAREASGSIRLTWPHAYAATSYSVWVRNTQTNVELVRSVTKSPFVVTGLTDNESYEFTVAATNYSGTSTYSDLVTATPGVTSACNILTYVFAGQPDAIITDTSPTTATINVTMPVGTDITSLSPTFTVSNNASCDRTSGTAVDFTNAQIYVVTAEDTVTSKTYTVTVTTGTVPNIFTWATATPGNWNDSTKWVNNELNGSKPMAGGQAYYVLNFTQPGTYLSTQNLNDGFLANQLNFGAAVTINGANSLALTANGAVLPTVNQNSSSAVAIDTPVSLAAMTTVVGTSNGQVTLSGAITGAGGLTKSNSGVLKLYGFSPASNTYSGGTIINNGILQLGEVFNGSTPICANPMGSGPVTLNSGAMIQCNRVTAANALTVNGGTLANYNGWGTTWSGAITMNATLMVHTAGYTELTGTISGAGGITKTGGAKLLVSGVNTYTGDTTVNEGTLLVKSDSIMNTNKLVIGGGKVAATGTLSVNTLFFGATQQAAGTWGATGSGATHIDDTHFASTTNDQNVVIANGVVNVLAGTVVNDYETWASTFPGFTNTGATADPDGDGMSNQQEYAFGLNPTTGSSVNPISSPLSGNAFSYTRRLNSGLVYTVWHSMNLETWDSTGATEGTPTVNGSVETVPVTLDPLLINESKLFIRVSAAEPAPAP